MYQGYYFLTLHTIIANIFYKQGNVNTLLYKQEHNKLKHFDQGDTKRVRLKQSDPSTSAL